MITTVTTAALTSSALVAAGLGAAAVISLITLLIMKELSSAELESGRDSPRLRFFAASLNVPIVALLLVFAVIVAVKVWEVL